MTESAAIRRTIQFVLLLNRFEDEALRRVVKASGYRSASEALRYLIRREDPEGHLDLMPDAEVPEFPELVELLKEARGWVAQSAGLDAHPATNIGNCLDRIDKALAALEGPKP